MITDIDAGKDNVDLYAYTETIRLPGTIKSMDAWRSNAI
jgi:hypothetical protein